MSDAQHHSKITKKIAEGIGEFPDPFFFVFYISLRVFRMAGAGFRRRIEKGL